MGLPFYIVTLLSIQVGEEGKRRVQGEGRGEGGGGNFYWNTQGEPLWRREAWSPKPCKGLAICWAKAIP